MKRAVVWLTVVSVLLLALTVGCRREAAQPTPRAPTPAPAAPGVAPTPTPTVAPGAPAPTPRTGGVFRRLWDDPPTLDPHLTTDVTSAFVIVEIFSGLVTLDTDLRVIPDIAERWEISPDGRTYTFYLRRGVKFHNGKEVTAEDFKYSFERAADPKTQSPVAETYLGDIVGVKEKLEGKATEISGIRVIDRYTLQITIDAPKVYFIAKLTYPTGFVVDREQIQRMGRRWTDQPNGTGPFKLREYRVGERIVLERNPDFYRGPPKLERVELILSGGSPMAMYENDEIHITGVGLADLERVRDPRNPLSKELVQAPMSFDTYYIGFNVTKPPFDDVKVRQALNHAINKELIATQVLSNLVTPAYGILPPGFPGYNPAIQDKGLKHNPELAKRLLAESKYAGRLPRIVMTVPGTGGSAGLDLEVIMDQWKQVLGVEVEVQQVEWATFLQELNRGTFQAFAGLGWIADYPDPQNFLDVLFHSKSPQNHTYYANPEVDRLLEQARVEKDWNTRVELYNKAEEIIVREAAWVPLWYSGERFALIKPYVKGYKLLPMIVPRLKDVWIER
ncbi:MAG: peptide ABC transporter substrate-binding protein [Dehalococcoidia bacterium]|nr:peptide ABC transporter substrate-binding protein [Dehalococcoidia bacterium]MDW8120085.1 peptide ABC transporter substrate-binding protein [Chloroflexota bacterium]